ncbi:hypothetical protein KUTeg_011021 [Tegillarca granosa]|uniref:Phosphatidylethanolamine N-methyltransferase n=1 Tax=Tegillarca granosa TaxID=220873 RepID=A0ABQ9F631_TEGGR|nr:hypothetical protein KUTeg_011021 [Tegillarca granosa]
MSGFPFSFHIRLQTIFKPHGLMVRRKPQGCCDDVIFLDLSEMDLNVDLTDVHFWVSLATIMFNPFFWNVVARSEYRNHTLEHFLGSPQRGCIFLGIVIVGLGILRDWLFKIAIESQPRWSLLHENWILFLGYACILFGCYLVFTSYWALGFYGTFLGDYFGILMDDKVTGFPFNITDNPMYWGSTLNFLGTALVKASQSGIFLSLVAGVSYQIAITFEG